MMNTYLEERLAEARRKELMRQAEINRLLRETRRSDDSPASVESILGAIAAALAVAVVALATLT